MNRYLWLLVLGALAGALGLAALRARPAVAPEAAPEPRREISTLSYVLGESGLDPALAAVPRGHRVVVAVQNARSQPVSLALQGYEDQVRSDAIAPGKVWHVEFLAERPGEAFAWLAGDVPVGRIAVTGSHLEEGHR